MNRLLGVSNHQEAHPWPAGIQGEKLGHRERTSHPRMGAAAMRSERVLLAVASALRLGMERAAALAEKMMSSETLVYEQDRAGLAPSLQADHLLHFWQRRLSHAESAEESSYAWVWPALCRQARPRLWKSSCRPPVVAICSSSWMLVWLRQLDL